jgi:D-3-phosphoglycerate dehydrogenase
MGYIILLARHLHIIDQKVKAGDWTAAQIQGSSLKNKTLGVIGVGSIGKAVVKRALASGMEVLGHDIAPIDDTFIQQTGMKQVDMDTLVTSSDFISLNCNLTSSNHHMIDREALEKMKNSAYLINTSRGPLIDEKALIDALTYRKIAGVALDVFEYEPLPAESKFRTLPNCILGAHNSSNTIDAVLRVNEMAIDNLLKGLGIEKNE